MTNHLLKLLQSYPDNRWHWEHVSSNPNITWEIVCQNPHLPWDYNGLTYNPNITLDIIKTSSIPVWNPIRHGAPNLTAGFCDRYWNPYYYVKNPNIEWHIFKTPCEEAFLDFASLHKSVTWDIVLNNPEFPWSYDSLSKNPNITYEIVEEDISTPNRIFENEYGMQDTFDKLSLYFFSENPNLIWENIEERYMHYFNWEKLSMHPNITCDIIEENPKKPWNYDAMSLNPNLTWDFVTKNIEKPWNWSKLSENPNITWDIVKNNLKSPHVYPWDFKALGKNPNITIEIIEETMNTSNDYEVIGSWETMSQNPNLTWNFVSKFGCQPNGSNNFYSTWHWQKISCNKFDKHEFFQRNEVCYL